MADVCGVVSLWECSDPGSKYLDSGLAPKSKLIPGCLLLGSLFCFFG